MEGPSMANASKNTMRMKSASAMAPAMVLTLAARLSSSGGARRFSGF
jgi:hypothetical protein